MRQLLLGTMVLMIERKTPIDYRVSVHLFQLDRVKQAASAAYTYFLANPKEEDAYKNVAFYREKAKVPDSDFVDLELKPYKVRCKQIINKPKISIKDSSANYQPACHHDFIKLCQRKADIFSLLFLICYGFWQPFGEDVSYYLAFQKTKRVHHPQFQCLVPCSAYC